MVAETTDSTFENDVLNSEIPVLVDFWAPWCAPCQILGPIIGELSKKVTPQAKVVKINVDENPQTAMAYGIRGIPTVVIFENGQVSNQLVGVRREEVYLEALGA
jgi:thioredoxin 1